MNFIARIEGVYRHRTRINLLVITIAGPWKSETFTFERTLGEPTGEWTWQVIPSVSVAVTLDKASAEFRVRLMDQVVGMHQIRLPIPSGRAFHFEPIKGNIVEGTASVQDSV